MAWACCAHPFPGSCSAPCCSRPRLQLPQRRDPRTAPQLLALWLRKKRPASSKDTPAPHCPPSPCPRILQTLTNKSWNFTCVFAGVPEPSRAGASTVTPTLLLVLQVLPGPSPNRSWHWQPQVVSCWCHLMGMCWVERGTEGTCQGLPAVRGWGPGVFGHQGVLRRRDSPGSSHGCRAHADGTAAQRPRGHSLPTSRVRTPAGDVSAVPLSTAPG